MQDENVHLVRYSKHIPRLLRQQLLCGLMSKYVPSTPFSDDDSHLEASSPMLCGPCGPTIQRFHGALLFVDISGFTALSLRLDVEALKNHINSYFSKMLDIVDKWEGDVVKFAGDALYIVWPTNIHDQSITSYDDAASVLSSVSVSNSAEFAAAAKKGLEKAVACGLEISSVCGNYEVRLATTTSESSNSVLSKLIPFNFGNLMGGASKISPTPSSEGTEDVVYLNVHSGVSCGLMAGVDITHNGRAEFFLVGEPLTGVAMAESQASKGDVVLDLAAHELLHGENAGNAVKGHLREVNDLPSPGKKGDGSLLCGCSRTESGLFQVSKLLMGGGKRKTRIKGQQAQQSTQGLPSSPLTSPQATSRVDIGELNMRIVDDIENELEKLFLSNRSHIRKEFYAFINTIRELSETDTRASLLIAGNELANRKTDDKKFSMFMKDILKKHFFEWMQYALFECVTLHVHEVVRSIVPSVSSGKKRLSSFHDVLRGSLNLLSSSLEGPEREHIPNIRLSAAAENSSAPRITIDELNMSASFKEKSKRTPTGSGGSSEINNGEVRTVIVMFIKIEKFDLHLKIDNKGKPINYTYNRFSFLDRTESEMQSDTLMLESIQKCFAVLCQSLQEHGGQLRQFIVDDKGTVCIGTFGLRGSAAVDNAAAALEAARRIIEGLRKQDLKASIGITSGKAYCGLVGSFVRHEYAVMGPSTNLSARLMCKAPAHGVICDADTVSRDRTHKFGFIAEVQAKGYSKPVMTYNPVFDEHDEDVEDSGRKLVSRPTTSHGGKKTTRVVNRASLRTAAQEVTDAMLTTLTASRNKMTANQKMTALGKTDFYINEATAKFDSSGNQKDYVSQKLYGREEELTQILSFLFDNDEQNSLQICFTGKTKMVTVCGSSGTGKTAMLNALERKLQNVVRTDHTCNMIILRNRTSSLQHDLPFRSWQVLVHKLFLTTYNSLQSSSSQGVSTTRSAVSDGFSKFSNFSSVIDAIWPQLPMEFQDKKDLLSVLSLAQSADQWQAAKPEDKTPERLEACSSLLAALVSAVASILKKFVLLIIVDVQTLDKWSLITLHKVFDTSTGAGVLAGYDTTETAQQSDAHGSSKDSKALDNVTKFFQGYSDYNRFKLLFLSALDKRATMLMVEQLHTDISKEDLEKIYEVSAGKPLYVTELVESLSKARQAGQTGLVKLNGQALADSVPIGSISHRIEEVICYRLDKLHLPSQVVLKAAAVAVSYGRVCTYSILKYMLMDNNLFSTNKAHPSHYEGMDVDEDEDEGDDAVLRMTGQHSVRMALLDLVQNEDFLILKGPSASIPREQLTTDVLLTAEFEFHIPLEQTTIYGLIVDVQKEYFHDRIALYLHREVRLLPLAEAKLRDLWEQGFHWDRAGLWSRSMNAYLQAARKAKEERNAVRCIESLTMSYQIFQNMEQKVCPVVLPEACRSYADTIAQALFKPTLETLRELETSADMILALKSTQEVFEMDPPSIADAIELHMMLAETHLFKWGELEVVMRLLSTTALLCAAAVWRPSGESRKITNDLSASSKNMKPSVSEDAYEPPRRSFAVVDYFRLFSLCAYVARFVAVEESFTVSVEYSKALLSVQTSSTALTDMNALMLVHAHALLALRYLQLNKTQRASGLMEDALKIYDPSVQSALLSSHFSVDLMPYALALLSQALFAEHDVSKGIAVWQRALACLNYEHHPYSSAIAIVVLMSTVHFVGDYQGLAAVVQKCQNDSSPCSEGLGPQIRKLVDLWLEVAILSSGNSSPQPKPEDFRFLLEGFIDLSKKIDSLMIGSTDTGATAPASSAAALLANRNSQQSPAAEASQSPEQTDNNELSLGKLSFLEIHGCALERVFIEVMCSLWHVGSKSQLFVLEQRVQHSLSVLLQSPAHDLMTSVAKGLNMVHSLAAVYRTGQSGNGQSAGAIYTAVTERIDQPLLLVLQLLLQKDSVYLCWLLACCLQSLPLHESISEEYRKLLRDSKDKLIANCGNPEVVMALENLAKRMHIPVV